MIGLPALTGDISGSVKISVLVDNDTDISTTLALMGIR